MTEKEFATNRGQKGAFRFIVWQSSSSCCELNIEEMWISKLIIVIIFCHLFNNVCVGLYMNPDSLTKAYNKAYLKQFPNAPKKIHQMFPQFHGNYIFKLSRVTQFCIHFLHFNKIKMESYFCFKFSCRKKKSLTYCHGNNVQL